MATNTKSCAAEEEGKAKSVPAVQATCASYNTHNFEHFDWIWLLDDGADAETENE